jgi:hypothetical protein
MNSISIGDWQFENYLLSAGYYTIVNNINNPKSSAFVSSSPTQDEIFRFATTQPSYFFLISVNRVLKCGILLKQTLTEKKAIFSYTVFRFMKFKFSYQVQSETLGEITEYRARELTSRIKWESGVSPFPLKAKDREGVPIMGEYLLVQPFEAVQAEVIKMINDYKLYE